MSTKHIHYDMIVAWAGGAEIQCRRCDDIDEEDLPWKPVSHPQWTEGYEYRVKPKTVWVRLYRYRDSSVMHARVVDEPNPDIQLLSRDNTWVSNWIEVEPSC
jgi:hypothetical protein